MSFPIYFVGAGPGDPDLITVRGKNILGEADRIVYAGSLISERLLKAHGNPKAEIISSASLSLEETHFLLVDGFRKGLKVVRLHSGDPSLYGAVHEQMALLDKENIPYEVVPGVSAVFAAAAKLKRELTIPGISQTIILTRLAGKTPVPEEESLRNLAAHRATLVLYLSVQSIEEVTSELVKSYPPSTPVVVAYRIGWPEEQFIYGTLHDIAEKVKKSGIKRQALIMVGTVFGDRDASKKSLLYDKHFSHGYRKARQ